MTCCTKGAPQPLWGMTIEGGYLSPPSVRCSEVRVLDFDRPTSRHSLRPQRIDGSARHEWIVINQREDVVLALNKRRATLYPVATVVVCDFAELPNGGAMDVAA